MKNDEIYLCKKLLNKKSSLAIILWFFYDDDKYPDNKTQRSTNTSKKMYEYKIIWMSLNILIRFFFIRIRKIHHNIRTICFTCTNKSQVFIGKASQNLLHTYVCTHTYIISRVWMWREIIIILYQKKKILWMLD